MTNEEIEKENAELKTQLEKIKSKHFTDIRIYEEVIRIAVEENPFMKEKEKYKDYLFDKAKHHLYDKM